MYSIYSMKTQILAAYQLFDDTFMFGANSAVHAYNWIFGGTKDELANNLVNIFSIAPPVGVFNIDLTYGCALPPPTLILSHYVKKINSCMRKLEEKSDDIKYI